MKNKITCLLAGAALFGATANAEIALGESLSAYGYIDMALTDGDAKGDTATSVAEFELGLSFAPAESKWSAVAELSFDSDTDMAASDSSAEFETVTISYQYSDALSFTFGNILSYQGFETFDATGLYQFSYAGSSIDTYNGGNGRLYSAAYAVGASADYSAGDFSVGIWAGDAADDQEETSIEYFVQYTGFDNLTLTAVVADDPGYETTNLWASYEYNDFTFAVESVETEESGTEVVDVQSFMAYYAMGDAGITVRISEGDYGANDFEKLTVSPSYAFSDNVFGLVEFSQEDYNDQDADTVAVELIYSF